jgi:hypothetical protein
MSIIEFIPIDQGYYQMAAPIPGLGRNYNFGSIFTGTPWDDQPVVQKPKHKKKKSRKKTRRKKTKSKFGKKSRRRNNLKSIKKRRRVRKIKK